MDRYHAEQDMLIEVKTSLGMKILHTDEIVFVEAAKKCSIVHLIDKEIITFHPLKWYNKYLIKPTFFRCHNSNIINCHFVDCFTKKDIRLKNNFKVPLSRNRSQDLVENLKKIKIEQ